MAVSYSDFVCEVVILCTGADGAPLIRPEEMPIVSDCFDAPLTPLETVRVIYRLRAWAGESAPSVLIH